MIFPYFSDPLELRFATTRQETRGFIPLRTLARDLLSLECHPGKVRLGRPWWWMFFWGFWRIFWMISWFLNLAIGFPYLYLIMIFGRLFGQSSVVIVDFELQILEMNLGRQISSQSWWNYTLCNCCCTGLDFWTSLHQESWRMLPLTDVTRLFYRLHCGVSSNGEIPSCHPGCFNTMVIHDDWMG